MFSVSITGEAVCGEIRQLSIQKRLIPLLLIWVQWKAVSSCQRFYCVIKAWTLPLWTWCFRSTSKHLSLSPPQPQHTWRSPHCAGPATEQEKEVLVENVHVLFLFIINVPSVCVRVCPCVCVRSCLLCNFPLRQDTPLQPRATCCHS